MAGNTDRDKSRSCSWRLLLYVALTEDVFITRSSLITALNSKLNCETQKRRRKVTGHLGLLCRLNRTIAQLMVLFKLVLKISFEIIEELNALKPSKWVPASLFLALQHCSCCSIMASFQLHSAVCLRKQAAVQELLECVTTPHRVFCWRFLSRASVMPRTTVQWWTCTGTVSSDARVPVELCELKRFAKDFA